MRSAISSATGSTRSASHHLVDQAQARGLGGVDQARGQQEIHGVDVADLLDRA
jgi:hypothetical protein